MISVTLLLQLLLLCRMYDVTHAHTGGARNSLVMRVVGLSDDVRAVRGRAVHMAVT